MLADVHMTWPLPDDEVALFFSPDGLVVVAPLPDGRHRIVATSERAPECPDAGFIQALLDARGPVNGAGRVSDVVWSSRFRVHHRVADAYRAGRVLLAGDAAHVHSPAGGQGMNTGIQDAMALGDALVAVIGHHAAESGLDAESGRPDPPRPPRHCDEPFRAETSMSTTPEADRLYTRVDAYIEELYGGDDPALAAADASLAESGMPPISVSPSLGRLLHLLVRLCNASRVLELGTLAGYSAIWMARALPEAGRLITIESSADHVGVARRNLARAGVHSLVEIRHGRALEVLTQLREEGQAPFDLIFVDADKAHLAEYLDGAVLLSRPGTLIVVDNVIRAGKVLEPDHEDGAVQGVRRFNEVLAGRRDLTSTLLQTVDRKGHDGIALAVVR